MTKIVCSLNIIKTYQAIHRHLQHTPSDQDRFKNFGGDKKPILARGASDPQEGETHSAENFHGRYRGSHCDPLSEKSLTYFSVMGWEI